MKAGTARALTWACQDTGDEAESNHLETISKESFALPCKQLSQDGDWHVIRYPDQIGSEQSCISTNNVDETDSEEGQDLSHAQDLSRRLNSSRNAGARSAADDEYPCTEPGVEEDALHCQQPRVKLCAEHECQTSGSQGGLSAFQQEARDQLGDSVANEQFLEYEGMAERGCQASHQPASFSRGAQTVYESALQTNSGGPANQQSQKAVGEASSQASRLVTKSDVRQPKQARVQNAEHSVQIDVTASKLSHAGSPESQTRLEKGRNIASTDFVDSRQKSQGLTPQGSITHKSQEDFRKTRPAIRPTSTPLQSSAKTMQTSHSRFGSTSDSLKTDLCQLSFPQQAALYQLTSNLEHHWLHYK